MPDAEIVNPAAQILSPRNRAFWGPHGLRAGWRLLLFILILIARRFAVVFTAHLIFGSHDVERSMGENPMYLLLSEGLAFALLLVATFIMSRLERRPLGIYGLGLKGALGKRFWEGTLWGFSAMSLMLMVMRLSGVFWFGPAHFDPRSTLTFGSLWGLGFFFVGILEEYFFRGYLQYTLYSGVGFWPATLITSLLFLAGHAGNPGETAVGLFNVFVAGFALAIMLWRTGNLWFAVGFHAAWDWAQSFFYGVPDSGLVTKGHFFEGVSHGLVWLSGGATGPEGSIFSTLVLILVMVLVLWRFKKSTYPDARWLPQQTGAFI